MRNGGTVKSWRSCKCSDASHAIFLLLELLQCLIRMELDRCRDDYVATTAKALQLTD
jgi:hypothetical protein